LTLPVLPEHFDVKVLPGPLKLVMVVSTLWGVVSTRRETVSTLRSGVFEDGLAIVLGAGTDCDPVAATAVGASNDHISDTTQAVATSRVPAVAVL